MSIAELRDRERGGADVVAAGPFKVDPQRAFAKLRDHRLADSSHYVLELLRAAVASSATEVVIRNDADDFEMRFDGAPLAREIVEDLFAHLLTSGTDKDAVRYRQLALGIVGALGLRPGRCIVRSNG